jgi:hypothetical protein
MLFSSDRGGRGCPVVNCLCRSVSFFCFVKNVVTAFIISFIHGSVYVLSEHRGILTGRRLILAYVQHYYTFVFLFGRSQDKNVSPEGGYSY